jgi:NAD(P)-dependent dehydrogenase (short-subunit alcohol dehydrogenase family)
MGIMSTELQGKTAIITGGSKGIGAATARRLHAAGVNTVLFDVDDEPGIELAAQLGSTAHYAHVDVSSESSVQSGVDETLERFGSLELLVNNAGIAPPHTLRNIPDGEWDRVLATNLTGAFHCTKAAVPHMSRAGGGSIVNISSVAGMNISMLAGMHYTTSKWGLRGFSRHMAYELAPRGIRVNVVCPGPTQTPLVESSSDEAWRSRTSAAVPLGRMLQPEDIANAILFFLGPQSTMCTGAELVVDGGVLIGSRAGYADYLAVRGESPDEIG